MTMHVIGAGSGSPELRRQHDNAAAARARLWGAPSPESVREKPGTLFVRGARSGANLPRNGSSVFYGKPRQAVDFVFAMKLVCEDRAVTPDQILNSTYCAAVAARHMLWTVMLDGGYSVADIARKFIVDHKTVTLGIQSFRQFQAEADAP
ncbi:hypothetical protein [Devosia sp. A369]